jgi:hypothetical protein
VEAFAQAFEQVVEPIDLLLEANALAVLAESLVLVVIFSSSFRIWLDGSERGFSC